MRNVRTQVDGLGDVYSDLAAEQLDFSKQPDPTRQEQKDECDINLILKRFGVGATGRFPQYGSMDTNMDLHSALGAIRDAKQAYNRLPDELKKEYPTWRHLLVALDTGRLVITGEEPKETQGETPKTPSTQTEPK